MSQFNFQQMKKMFIYFLNRFRPESKNKALITQQRLAFLYAVIGWNGFIYLFYTMSKGTLSLDAAGQKKAIISNAQESGKIVELTQIKGFNRKSETLESNPTIVSSDQ